MLVELLFRQTKASVGSFLAGGILEFDASLSERHNDEVEVTEHPVETGASITDHVRRRPSSIEINGVVTNTPLVYLASVQARSPVVGDYKWPTQDRVEAAYAMLKKLLNSGQLVDVVTALRVYTNMILQSVSVTRDATKGNILDCTINLREITLAKSLLLGLPTPTEIANKAKQNKGKTGADQGSASQGVKSQSLLSSMAGAFGL